MHLVRIGFLSKWPLYQAIGFHRGPSAVGWELKKKKCRSWLHPGGWHDDMSLRLILTRHAGPDSRLSCVVSTRREDQARPWLGGFAPETKHGSPWRIPCEHDDRKRGSCAIEIVDRGLLEGGFSTDPTNVAHEDITKTATFQWWREYSCLRSAVRCDSRFFFHVTCKV